MWLSETLTCKHLSICQHRRAGPSAAHVCHGMAQCTGPVLAVPVAAERSCALLQRSWSMLPYTGVPACYDMYVLPMQDLRAAAEQVAAAVGTAAQECIAHRRPLVRAPPKRAADIRQFNPKFEEEYVARKDYDPDR